MIGILFVLALARNPVPPGAGASASFGCPALPAATGRTLTIGPRQTPNLAELVAGAAAGTTILLRDGTYRLGGRSLSFRRASVTVRSLSGDAAKVVLDGEYRTNEAVVINASDVTVAHLTIRRAKDHLVHVYPQANSDVRDVHLYDLHLVDAGEQFVKVNPDAARTTFIDVGRVECSTFQLTSDGRGHVETLGVNACYTGGIDIHAGRAWVIRLNRFEDIYCHDGRLAEHAIHVWTGSRDTVVENNTILNCARGIGFGLGESGPGRHYPDDAAPGQGYVGHQGGIIRNNVIYANVPEYDTGIGLEQARDVRVYHNTVFATATATGAFSSIDARFANTRADVRNNLVNDITTRLGATVTQSHNLQHVPAAAFVNAAAADLHLRASYTAAIGQGEPLDEAGLDMDGQPHGTRPDIGADERGTTTGGALSSAGSRVHLARRNPPSSIRSAVSSGATPVRVDSPVEPNSSGQ